MAWWDNNKLEWRKLANEGSFEEAIISFVRENGDASFVELEEAFSVFLETKGDTKISPSDNENIIYWRGLSKKFADIIISLCEAKTLCMRSVNSIIYVVDGRLPDLPEARKQNYKYKNPHWFPVVLCKK